MHLLPFLRTASMCMTPFLEARRHRANQIMRIYGGGTWQLVHSKALFVKLVWLPSHLTNSPSNKPIPAFVQPWHVAANEAVDELAKLAAK